MLEELKKQVYEANMELPRRGLITYTWGNVSGIDRKTGYFVIKPSGVDYDALSPDDMVVMDLDGNKIEGKYKPLTVVQAVETCKEIVPIFRAKGIDIIRIGLQNTDEITDPSVKGSEVVAGPYHPAFRQLVEANLWYDDILKRIKEMNTKVKRVKIIINPKDVNNVVGHKRENIQKLKDVYELDLIIEQDEKMKEGKFKLEILEKYPEFLDEKE